MKNKMYCIKDVLVGFKPPFTAPNNNCAIRLFTQLVNAVDSNDVKTNPSDYQLFYIGELDDQTGEFESSVEFLANAIDLKEV